MSPTGSIRWRSPSTSSWRSTSEPAARGERELSAPGGQPGFLSLRDRNLMASISRFQPASSAGSNAASRLKLGLYACLLVGPALLDVVVCRWLPLLVAIYRALYQSILLDPLGGKFVGLAQYRTLLADPLFYSSLRTTITYGLLRIPTTVVFGFVLALLVNSK